MNPTRWHVEKAQRQLIEYRDAQRSAEKAATYHHAAEIVREVFAQEPPLCKCGHGIDKHPSPRVCVVKVDTTPLMGAMERHIERCPCEKYDPAPKEGK